MCRPRHPRSWSFLGIIIIFWVFSDCSQVGCSRAADGMGGRKQGVACWGRHKQERKRKRNGDIGREGGFSGGRGREQKEWGFFREKGDREKLKGGRRHLELGKHSFSRTLLHHLPIYMCCFVVCLGVAWLLWVTCSVFFSLLVFLDTPCSSP